MTALVVAVLGSTELGGAASSAIDGVKAGALNTADLLVPGAKKPRKPKVIRGPKGPKGDPGAQGPAGAIFAVQDLKAKKIAIFDDGTTGPRGVADEVEKKAKQLGATPLRYVIRSGDKDFRAILATVPKDVSVIYASLWAPDAALIRPGALHERIGATMSEPMRLASLR
jgi:hypothetical protein